MSKKIHTNQKRMNHDDRVVIEKGLDNSKPMSTIAEKLGKDPTTSTELCLYSYCFPHGHAILFFSVNATG